MLRISFTSMMASFSKTKWAIAGGTGGTCNPEERGHIDYSCAAFHAPGVNHEVGLASRMYLPAAGDPIIELSGGLPTI